MPEFSLAYFGLNFLDVVIIVVFIFYAIEGFEVGFAEGLLDLFNFVVSFALGLKFYGVIGGLLTQYVSIPPGFANAFGFFIVAFLTEILLAVILQKPFHRLWALLNLYYKDTNLNKVRAYITSLNQFFGIFPAVISAFILLSFLLTIVISLPFSPLLKHTVSSSRFGNLLVANTQAFEKNLNDVFGGAVYESLTFLTVKPQSDEFVSLLFQTKAVAVDEQAESYMLVLINRERESRGLPALVVDYKLTELARSYSKDMFGRGYFSHYTPEGLSPFDRMASANISYTFAAENLALAPNTDLAMQGLMQSKGHRDNILSPNFRKVGIGVIDGGIYGEMFTQEFTD